MAGIIGWKVCWNTAAGVPQVEPFVNTPDGYMKALERQRVLRAEQRAAKAAGEEKVISTAELYPIFETEAPKATGTDGDTEQPRKGREDWRRR